MGESSEAKPPTTNGNEQSLSENIGGKAIEKTGLSRREFLKFMALVGASAILKPVLSQKSENIGPWAESKEARLCHEAIERHYPELKGKVEIHWAIGTHDIAPETAKYVKKWNIDAVVLERSPEETGYILDRNNQDLTGFNPLSGRDESPKAHELNDVATKTVLELGVPIYCVDSQLGIDLQYLNEHPDYYIPSAIGVLSVAFTGALVLEEFGANALKIEGFISRMKNDPDFGTKVLKGVRGSFGLAALYLTHTLVDNYVSGGAATDVRGRSAISEIENNLGSTVETVLRQHKDIFVGEHNQTHFRNEIMAYNLWCTIVNQTKMSGDKYLFAAANMHGPVQDLFAEGPEHLQERIEERLNYLLDSEIGKIKENYDSIQEVLQINEIKTPNDLMKKLLIDIGKGFSYPLWVNHDIQRENAISDESRCLDTPLNLFIKKLKHEMTKDNADENYRKTLLEVIEELMLYKTETVDSATLLEENYSHTDLYGRHQEPGKTGFQTANFGHSIYEARVTRHHSKLLGYAIHRGDVVPVIASHRLTADGNVEEIVGAQLPRGLVISSTRTFLKTKKGTLPPDQVIRGIYISLDFQIYPPWQTLDAGFKLEQLAQDVDFYDTDIYVSQQRASPWLGLDKNDFNVVAIAKSLNQ